MSGENRGADNAPYSFEQDEFVKFFTKSAAAPESSPEFAAEPCGQIGSPAEGSPLTPAKP
jgi:hypothetical protein